MTFRGNVALITGAGSGMGQLAAWRLAAAGTTVAALDVDEEALARTTRHAPMIHAFSCDVRENDAVVKVVAEIESRFGPIDRVMNAAAIAPTGPLLSTPIEEFGRAMDINYLGLVHVTMAVLPQMIERKHGDVVQFASLAGWVPSPYLGAYSATKAAVVSFSETLSRECRDSGVRFVCVCPPPVATPMLDHIRRHAPSGFDRAPLAPEVVLDVIEAGLEAGQFFVFPGRGTATLWRLRRLLPEVVWRGIEAQ